MPKKVLITGGAGFIGSHLTGIFLGKGDQVTILDDLSTGSEANLRSLSASTSAKLVVGSVTDKTLVESLVEDCDLIFHMAAIVGVDLVVKDPVDVIETNIFGTHNVVSSAARMKKRTLIASTSEVYGKSEAVPFKEDGDRLMGPTTASRWSYATTKAIDEILGLAYHQRDGAPITIFRLFNTVGPRQTGEYGMVLPRFVDMAVNGEPLRIFGDGEQSRCFCDVRDVVKAIVGLSETGESIGEVYNIGGTTEITVADLARLVVDVVVRMGLRQSAKDDFVYIPYKEAYAPGFEDLRRRSPDTTKIHNLLRWKPRISLHETIQAVIESKLNAESIT